MPKIRLSKIDAKALQLQGSHIKSAAKTLAGLTGRVDLTRKGFKHKGKLLAAETGGIAKALMVDRNLRNLVFKTPLNETQTKQFLTDLISDPKKAISDLRSLQIMLNMPAEIDKALDFELIRVEEQSLFVAREEEGKLISIQAIKEGHVRGLGEETIDFMRDNGFKHIFIGPGFFLRRADRMHPGGHLVEGELGMEDERTSDWTRVIPYLDPSKCKVCEQCVLFCPEGVIEIIEEEKKPDQKKPKKLVVIEPLNCKGCGICAEKCPDKVDAITMIDKASKEGQQLMKQALRKGDK
jgi:2-oxoacid:acceptor oxidoreductase delta subunit (pyruvate/2-ketoisovalerate family)